MYKANKTTVRVYADTPILLSLILLFSLFSCKEPAAPRIQPETQIVPSTENKKESIPYACDFDRFLRDPHTPELARNIYLDKEWSLNRDNQALALLDSLLAKDKAARPFYFKVVTKSYRKADGYYSEGLGLAAYEFVTGHTQEFTAYFDDTACHTAQDLADWADMVTLELAISREGEYDKPVVAEFMQQAKSNCKDCTAYQRETLKRFGALLKEKWRVYSKTRN